MTASSDGASATDSTLRRWWRVLRHPRVRAKVLISVLLAAVITLTAQFAISYRATISSLDSLESRRVTENLHVTLSAVEEHRLVLQRLALDTAAVAAPSLEGRNATGLRKTVFRLIDDHGISLAFVLDAHGRPVAASEKVEGPILSEQAVSNAENGAAATQWASWAGRLWLLAATPIYSDDQAARHLGTVVVAEVVDNAFAAVIRRSSSSELAFALNGDVVAVTDPAIIGLANLVEHSPREAGDRFRAAGGFSGTSRALAVPGSRADVVIATSRKPILDARRQLVLDTTLAAFGALAVAVIIAVVLIRQLLRPLITLTDAAHALAFGELQRRVPVSPVKRDEVNELAHAFNHMAAQVAEAQETLHRAAIRDGLTGLLNHREFFRRLGEELARADRAAVCLSMLMIDLDHFKIVNDTHGHLAGDALLTETARMIERSVREGDVVARYAGDEFGVILPVADAEQAAGIAERIRRGAAELSVAADLPQGATVTLSVGVMTREPGQCGANRTVELADGALYRAKNAGRDRVEAGAESA